MVIKKQLVLSILVSISYPSLFVIIYDSNISIVLCSFIHAIFGVLVIYRVVSKSLLSYRNTISLPEIFILTNLIYFYLSSIKYFENELYPGFVQDNFIRLAYSLLALFILWLSFEFINAGKFKHTNVEILTKHDMLRNILILVLLSFIIFNIIDIFNNKGIGYGYLMNIDLAKDASVRAELPFAEKVRSFLLSSGFLMILIVPLVILAYHKTLGKIFLLLAISSYSLLSLFTGSRGVISFFILFTMFGLVRLFGVGKKLIIKLIIFSPIAIILLSLIVLSIANRIEIGDLASIKKQLAYRFDLTDYAATLIQQNGAFEYHGRIIIDALFYSMPSILYENKYNANLKTQEDIIAVSGLNISKDYTDTFFSIGAQLFGIVGFVVFPFIVVILYKGIETCMYSCFKVSANYIVIALIPIVLRVETDLNSLFAVWRYIPLYVLLLIILFKIFVNRISPVYENWVHRTGSFPVRRGQAS